MPLTYWYVRQYVFNGSDDDDDDDAAAAAPLLLLLLRVVAARAEVIQALPNLLAMTGSIRARTGVAIIIIRSKTTKRLTSINYFNAVVVALMAAWSTLSTVQGSEKEEWQIRRGTKRKTLERKAFKTVNMMAFAKNDF